MREETSLIIGVLIPFVFLYMIVSTQIIMNDRAEDHVECYNNRASAYINNATDARFYQEERNDKTYCCGESDLKTYERDFGTLSYFISGRTGYYKSTICVEMLE